MLSMENLLSAIGDLDVFQPPTEYMRDVLRIVCEGFDFKFSSVLKLDDAGNGSLAAAYNLPEDYPNQVAAVKESVLSSPSGEAISTGQIVVVADVSKDPRMQPWHEVIASNNLRTIVWLPMISQGRAIGTVNLYDTSVRDFKHEDLAVLRQVSPCVSLAIRANDHIAAIDQHRFELQEKMAVIEAQKRTILELSTPVMEGWDGVLILPLIGAIDAVRAQQLMSALLEKIAETQATVAIMDVTGVSIVDTFIADHLVKAIEAARLLGTEVILTGVSPANARTIAKLYVDLSNVVTKSSLKDGLKWAFAHVARS